MAYLICWGFCRSLALFRPTGLAIGSSNRRPAEQGLVAQSRLFATVGTGRGNEPLGCPSAQVASAGAGPGPGQVVDGDRAVGVVGHQAAQPAHDRWLADQLLEFAERRGVISVGMVGQGRRGSRGPWRAAGLVSASALRPR